jgi:hypothetical protein
MPTAWEEYKKKIGVVRPWDIMNPSSERSLDSEANARFDICLDCDELIRLTKQCKQCGCVMPLKVKLKKAECPLGKW